MSHLRPIDPETGQAKKIEDYTEGERASALVQISDDHQKKISENKPIPPESARLAKQLAQGSGKEGTLEPQVEAAANQTGNTDAPSNAPSAGGTQDDEDHDPQGAGRGTRNRNK